VRVSKLAAQGFQAELVETAEKKRRELKKRPPKKPAVKKPSTPELLAEIRDALKALLGRGDRVEGDVDFVVTERDADGKPKAFKVVR
jgi:hypothetical protein